MRASATGLEATPAWAERGARRRTRAGRLLSALLVWLVASPVLAQTVWDPDRYLDLTSDGQALYQEALEHPVDSEARRDGLFEAGRHMKEALGMVRTALGSGEYDQEVRAAMRDYFTLMENLVVIWLALDACGPAQGLTDEARANPRLMPEDAVLFDNLDPRLSACHERAGTWVWSRYQGLVARADMRREQAVDGGRVDSALLAQAAEASAAALAAYREALLEGALGPVPVADPVAELVDRYEQTLNLQLDAADCEAAAATEALSELDRAGLLQWTRGRLTRAGDVAGCVQGEVVVAAEGVEARQSAGGAGLGARRTGAWALIGAGIVLGLSGVAVELGTLDERDDLDGFDADCAVGSGRFCDDEARTALRDDLEGRELARTVLLGVAGAAIVTGVALMVTADDEAPPTGSVTVAPTVARGEIGVVLGASF